jgi:phosphate transport system protein
MGRHIVASFDADLKALSALITEMGKVVGEQINNAGTALRLRDEMLARQVVASDKVVDDLQHRVEEAVILLIAKRQPVAVDLREIIATLKIASDLERIGDLAKNNAKRVLAIAATAPAGLPGVNLNNLSERVDEALVQVMQSYAARDEELAKSVWMTDGDIDTMYTALFRELLTYMMEDPRNIGYCAHLLFCAKNLERIGDHATNIAENVHFIATGSLPSGDRPKGPSPTTAP